MKRLSRKEEAFVEHYVICLNGAEAARRANYAEKSARQQASRLLTKDYIQAAIKERLDEKYISAAGVLSILGDIATSSMEHFVSLDGDGNPVIDLKKAAHNNKLHLAKKIKRTRHTRIIKNVEYIDEELSIEMYDKQAAAVTMMKHHKLLVDRLEISDWRKELEEVGLDPADEFEKLVNKAADHIERGARSADDRSAGGSEETE